MCMEQNEGYHQPCEVPLPQPLLRKSARLHLLLTSNFHAFPHHLKVLRVPAPPATTTTPNHHPSPLETVLASSTLQTHQICRHFLRLFWFCPAAQQSSQSACAYYHYYHRLSSMSEKPRGMERKEIWKGGRDMGWGGGGWNRLAGQPWGNSGFLCFGCFFS